MQDRHVELLNFEIEVKNILETKAYDLTNKEKLPLIKNWLGWEGLQLMKMFTHEEKENVEQQKVSLQY